MIKTLVILLILSCSAVAEFDLEFSRKISELTYGYQTPEKVDQSLESWRIHCEAALDEDQPDNIDQFLSGLCYLFGARNMFSAARMINDGRTPEIIQWMTNRDMCLRGPWLNEEVKYGNAIIFLIEKLRESEV